MRTPNRIRAPLPSSGSTAPSGGTDGLSGFQEGDSVLATALRVPPQSYHPGALPATRTHSHSLSPKGAPRQPARKPEQVQPRRAPGRVYTNLFARGRLEKNPVRSPHGGPG